MHISSATAMRIVTDLSDIIRQKVNLMDENGVVIASTDSFPVVPPAFSASTSNRYCIPARPPWHAPRTTTRRATAPASR